MLVHNSGELSEGLLQQLARIPRDATAEEIRTEIEKLIVERDAIKKQLKEAQSPLKNIKLKKQIEDKYAEIIKDIPKVRKRLTKWLFSLTVCL